MTGPALTIKPKVDCRWDFVALGEVLLRLDPGEGRIATARTFQAWEGGGEYNVARNLSHCFGLQTTIVTALADNPIGRLIQNLMRQGGVDQSHVRWVPYDGVGRSARNGLYFAERGFGLRAALGCADRAHTAVAQLTPGDIDWEHLFGHEGVRWFHTGGVFCGLSPATPRVAREAMDAARRHGTVVSFDLNFRESLWRASGGRAAAQALNRSLVPLVDVLFGLAPDQGFHGEAADPAREPLAIEAARRILSGAATEFPNLKVIATTLRREHSATRVDTVALGWSTGRFSETRRRDNLEVLDRIGAGDAFAAGVVQGLLEGRDFATALECGAALGALTMTTPGDTSMASRAEVEAAMQGARPVITR